MKISDVIYPANTKKVIQIEDIVDAFRVVYEDVGPFHNATKTGITLNKLRSALVVNDK